MIQHALAWFLTAAQDQNGVIPESVEISMLKSFLKPPNSISAVGNYGKVIQSMDERKLIDGMLIKLMYQMDF
jgi:hypothetical protein